MDLETKALKQIEKILKKWDKPFISWSGGKDSIVVMHLVHRVDDSIPLIFADTGVNHPSVRKVKKHYESEGKTIISTRQNREHTFWDIVEKYGWPIGARSSGTKKAVSNCCKLLKKQPMADATEGYDLEINGLTAYESWTRYCRIKGDGNYKFVKSRGKDGRQVLMPIAWWHTKDVWEYLDKHEVVVPEIYMQEVEGFTREGRTELVKGVPMDRDAIRVGCWTCPLPMKYSPNVMKQLREYYPKLWKTLMKKGLAKEVADHKLGGQGSLTDGYFTEDTEDYWLKNRPCFFDKI